MQINLGRILGRFRFVDFHPRKIFSNVQFFAGPIRKKFNDYENFLRIIVAPLAAKISQKTWDFYLLFYYRGFG